MSEITTAEVRALYGGQLGTHSFGCWKFHPVCAALALADRLDRLEGLFALEGAAVDLVPTLGDGIRAAEEEGR